MALPIMENVQQTEEKTYCLNIPLLKGGSIMFVFLDIPSGSWTKYTGRYQDTNVFDITVSLPDKEAIIVNDIHPDYKGRVCSHYEDNRSPRQEVALFIDTHG